MNLLWESQTCLSVNSYKYQFKPEVDYIASSEYIVGYPWRKICKSSKKSKDESDCVNNIR